MSINKQSITISYLRILSTILIIICHILQHFENKFAWILNIGVQIFLCISGYLNAKKIEKQVIQFYLKKIQRVMIPYYLWLTTCFIFYIIFQNDLITLKKIIIYILSIQALIPPIQGLGHLWFITIIMTCYALTPIINKLHNNFKNKFWIISIAISTLLILITPKGYNYILSILVYFCGFYIKKYEYQIKYITIIIAIILAALVPFYEIKSNNLIDSLVHAVGGALIFAIAKNLDNYIAKLKYPIVAKFINDYSYEIYLTHLIYIIGPFSLLNRTNYNTTNILIVIIAIAISSFMLKLTTSYIQKKFFIYNKIPKEQI